MADYAFFLGVDVSKATLDIHLENKDGKTLAAKRIMNSVDIIAKNLSELARKHKLEGCILVCAEDTGLYSRHLAEACRAAGMPLWLERPLSVKRASAGARGKSDAVDAGRIAEYARRYSDKAVPYEAPDPGLKSLHDLESHRRGLLDQLTALTVKLNEIKQFEPDCYPAAEKLHAPVLAALAAAVADAEKLVKARLAELPEVRRNVKLAMSVPGIGLRTALQLVWWTRNFTRFDNPRQLACYAGLAPFPNESGSSVRGKPKTSKMANHKLKTALHLAAMAASRSKSHFRDYFRRKVAEGKSKLLVINAIRAKLVHCVMAVVKRGTPYVHTYKPEKYAAAA